MAATDAGKTATTPSSMRRVATSSFTGSLVEYYDFLLYSTASALVFNQVFFSNLDPVTGTIASFGTFAAGYLARPVGGLIFGHYGDILGRKKVLVLTMLLMGTVSVLIGLLPTYAQIGAAAPVLLIVLRLLQGVAVGGEWGGAMLMSAEHATSRRGLWASFTNAGAPAGLVLSSAVLGVMVAVTSEAQFLAWGWRIPFLLSAVLLIVGLWIRLSITESPVFQDAVAAEGASRRPLADVLRNSRRPLALAIGVAFGIFLAQGALTTYAIAYATGQGFTRGTVLQAATVSSAGAVFTIIAWSALTDVVGRRPVMIGAAVAMSAWMFAFFPLLRTGETPMLFLAFFVGQAVIHGAFYGPLAALMSELFGTRARYTGSSLAYQVGGIGAGVTPVLFAGLAQAGLSTVVFSGIIAAACAFSVICLLALGETKDRDLTTV